MSEMISSEYLVKFFSSNPAVCCQFRQNDLMWSLSLPILLCFSTTYCKYEGIVIFKIIHFKCIFNAFKCSLMSQYIELGYEQDTLRFLRVLSAVMLQSGNLKMQHNVFWHITVHMGLCLNMGDASHGTSQTILHFPSGGTRPVC